MMLLYRPGVVARLQISTFDPTLVVLCNKQNAMKNESSHGILYYALIHFLKQLYLIFCVLFSIPFKQVIGVFIGDRFYVTNKSW